MRKFFRVILLFFACSPFFGQNGAFAPFVSRLKAASQEQAIVLTWKAPSGIKGSNLIYRHTQEINEKNIALSRLVARIDISIESYVDTPPDSREYFYCVLVEDTKKTLHRLFIPFRNITSRGIAISPFGKTAPVTETAITAKTTETKTDASKTEIAVTDRAVTETGAASITGIQARTEADAIIVSFTSSDPGRDLIIFRNTEPILSADDLIASISPTALPENTKSFKDYPIPGIDYYYAVLDAEQFKIGKYKLYANQNTMTSPVRIPEDVARTGLPEVGYTELLPLPYLSITKSVESNKSILASPYSLLPEYKKLSDKTKKVVDMLVKRIGTAKKPDRYFELLPADKAGNQTGDGYIVQTIARDFGTKKDFSGFKSRIADFLKTQHGEEVTARARFYAGEANYFLGNYRDALVNFLLADSRYYLEIQPWVDACLFNLINSKK